MSPQNPRSHAQASGDPADRHDFLTRVALGEDPESAAQDMGVPFSFAKQWLAEAHAVIEMSDARMRFVNSLVAHGGSPVSAALEVLERALENGENSEAVQMARKIVMASGVLGAMIATGPEELVEQQVQIRESADRLRFLAKLEAIGVTEAEWSVMARPAPLAAQRGRPKKKG